MTRKGQMWSLDFILSAVVFSIAIALLLFAWNFTTSQTNAQMMLNDMESIALSITESLVRTPGNPTDWNLTSAQSLGLASDENILDSSKVEMFVNMSYVDAKSLMGIVPYDFYIEFLGTDGSVLTGSVGQNLTSGSYPSDPDLVVPVNRFALMDGEITRIRFILWEQA